MVFAHILNWPVGMRENNALVRYEVIKTNSRYALVGYFITSYLTRAHGIIVIYTGSDLQCS